MGNQDLFGQAYQQIQSKMMGGNSRNFQMLSKSQSFNWPVPTTGQLSPQAYQFMSAAPAYSPVGQFGGVGVSTLFSNYKRVFDHVGKEDSPETRQQHTELSNRATELRNKSAEKWGDAKSAYNVIVQNVGEDFTKQYPSFYNWMENSSTGQSWMKTIDDLSEEADIVSAEILALTRANYPTALQEALDLMKLPTGEPSAGNAPRGWAIVKDGAGVKRWQPSFTIADSSQDWRAELTNGSIGKTSITLEASKSDSSITSSWAGGDASYEKSFWGFHVDGSWSDTNISESDTSITATIEMESSTVVNITPGDWYDGGFLRQLANAGNSGSGYQIKSPYTAKGGEHPLFGKGGLCPTMVTGLVVAYKPSFTLTMKTSTYKSFEREIEASAGLRIGPFNFGGSGGHYENIVSTTGDTTTIKNGDTSDDPVIIGVTIGFPGMPEGGPENALISVPEMEEMGMYNYNGEGGLDIYSEGKIQIMANGKYHFHVTEQV